MFYRVSFNLPQVERAPPVAITNKTPAYEYYGFVMYLASFVILGNSMEYLCFTH